MCRYLLGCPYVQQRARQARIVEVELRGLDQSFGVIVMIGFQQVTNVACLQYGNPSRDSRNGNAALIGQRRKVEQLSDTPCTQFNEANELAQIADVLHQTHIPFYIGLDIKRVVIRRCYILIIKTRITSVENLVIDCPWKYFALFHFRMRKRQKFQYGSSSGQRLVDIFHQQEIVRTGQQIHPLASLFIRMRLDIGEQSRNPLGFVDNRFVRISLKKTSRIIRCEQTHIGVFKRNIFIIGKSMTQQSRFTRLPGAGQGHYWIFLRKF